MNYAPSQSLSQTQSTSLSKSEGQSLLWASEAFLKGALETEFQIAIIAGTKRGAFRPVFDLGLRPAVAGLLRQHQIRLVATTDAGRAVTLASQAARSGKAGLALIANDELDETMTIISQACAEPIDRGGAMCLVLEDQPSQCPASCPRQAAQRLNLVTIEPANLEQFRDGIEHALMLSRAGRCVIGLVVHTSILRSGDTLEMGPNRVLAAVDAVQVRKPRLRKKQRSPRWSEIGGSLRMARRLELNRFRAIPNPGERVSVGFITIGPADLTLLHLTNVLGLFGRVPVLQLELISPIDESAVERMLGRCQKIIVLEPRPGSIESSVLAVAESMRRNGEQPAVIWGRSVPADSTGTEHALVNDDDLHPSVLARKIAHLLHDIRPTLQVTSQFVPDPPPLPMEIPARGMQVGSSAALAVIKRIVTDVDQWLRDRASLEERGVAPTVMAIDGTEPPVAAERIVHVETWDHRRFQHDGIAAMIQAAREDQPWIFIAFEVATEQIRDLERLARGAAPAERADRVKLETANLSDRIGLRDVIREAALVDQLTVIIVRDGPPAQFDVDAIESAPGGLAEIDQLGFEPRQRMVRSADEVCAIRPAPEIEDDGIRLAHVPASLKTEFSGEECPSGSSAKIVVRVRPLFEEVEVVRTRPPMRNWQTASPERLPTPQVVHGKQSHWRAHCAGYRGEMPGQATRAICEAGRLMGYHVRSVLDPTPIGPGRRAWAQVLFTRPRADEEPMAVTAAIPFGEADLLLGLDARETLRAIDPDASLRVACADRTHVVANAGAFTEELDAELSPLEQEPIRAALNVVTRAQPRLADDFAAACRTWFHTDRVTDMALLGAAFQMGLIPVSTESIEAAIGMIESRGYGRSREAFEFGRRLAVDARLFTKPKDEHEEDVSRLARRMVLSLSRGGWGGGSRARSFSQLLQNSLQSMASLGETDPGRAARRDFVVACHRCRIWGGLEYAQRYAELITRLYTSDRGDTGRRLTRNAVLPLAEAMLIGDPLYVASMASSSEQRRRMRLRLNVKLARGDRIERRYLTRFELVAFNRKLRADIRSSDWPARVVALGARLMPKRWRGSRRERELREYLIEVIKRATANASDQYEQWAEALLRLQNQAVENRLRGMALAEVKMLVESQPQVAMPEATPELVAALASEQLK